MLTIIIDEKSLKLAFFSLNFLFIWILIKLFHSQIISDYCKNVYQSKPFSHIMMELFKKLIIDPNFNAAPPADEQQNKSQLNQVINGDK